ncbi:hypothetical protein X975_09190, partial [Stegodyphus mimosarum]
MFGTSALSNKKQMKFQNAIYINISAIIIAFLLYIERVLKSEAYGSDLHLFIIFISLINCFKLYKSIKSYEAFYKQMNDQYKSELQLLKSSGSNEELLEFEEFMELNNGESEQTIWNSKMNRSVSIIYLALFGTYASAKILQDYLLDYYNMINNIGLFTSFLISTGYLIFDEQNIAECMNQDIRNLHERMKKYTTENFPNPLDIKYEIQKESCFGDVSSKIVLNSSQITSEITLEEITREEKKQSSFSDKNMRHEDENCYVSQETTYIKGETKNLNLSISDCKAHEAQTDIADKVETTGKSYTNIQVISEQECPLQQIENETKQDSEKGVYPGLPNQDHSDKHTNKKAQQCNSIPNNNIIEQRETNNDEYGTSDYSANEAETDVAGKGKTLNKVDNNQQGIDKHNCPSNSTANMTVEDSEKDTDPGASKQGYTEKDIEQNKEEINFVSNDDIIELREHNNRESSSPDRSIHEAKTHIALKEKTSGKTDDNLQGIEKKCIDEKKCSPEATANMSSEDAENDIYAGASIQEQSDKTIKQNCEQGNSVQDDNIFEEKESRNKESSPSHPSTNEAEIHLEGIGETSRKADEILQVVDEQNDRSEMITNVAGNRYKNGINLGASTQNHSEKDVKENQEQWNTDSDDNIIEPRESNNRETSPSVSSRNEIEANAGRKEETSRKGHSNMQGMNIKECVSEPTVNSTGLDSETDLDEGASNENRSEKDSKKNEVQENSFPEDNAIEPKDSNNRESSSLDSSIREANKNTEEKNDASEKAVHNLQRENITKCPSKPIVNVIGRDSAEVIDQDVSYQGRQTKHSKQNGVLQNPIPDENNAQRKGSNNSESRSSDSTTDEDEIDVAEKQKALEQQDKNLQGIVKHKCTLEAMANITGKGSKKDIDQNAFTEGCSDKGYAQNEKQPFSVSDENIDEENERNNGESSLSDCSIIKTETGVSGKTSGKLFDNIQCLDNQTCPSEQMANTTGKNTEKDIDPDASINNSTGKAINQNEDKCSSPTSYDIIQERENINREPSASGYSTNKAETHVAGKEKTLVKVDNNQQGMDGQNCPSNTIANMTGEDSEKDKEPGALNQDHTGKEMEETDAQRISVPKDNIIEQRENNNGESSSPHLSRHEAQSHIGANEKMSLETDDNLQGKEEEKCSSKTTTNMSGDNSENDIKLGASIQEQSEKRIIQSWEQRNSVQDDNIFKQKESNNKESSFVHLTINKAETDVAGVREKSREADECLQGVDEQNDRSERTAGKKSEKGINLGATTQNHSEKDVKENQEQWNTDSDNNIVEPRESNNRESSPSVSSRKEIEADAGRKEETSRKGHSNIQGMNIEECVSEPSVNRTGLDSEKDLDEGASNENRSEKDSKQNEVQENSFPEDNAIEPKDCNNRESSSLDSSIREANTNTEEKNEASKKAVDNLQRANVMKCPSKSNVNVKGRDSEEFIDHGVSYQGRQTKHSKQNWVLQNAIPDENNPQQKGSNNNESRSSDSTTDEAEIDVAEKQKALEQRDKNLQDVIKHKCTLEAMANITGKGSKKDIDQNAFTEGCSYKGYAQNEKQPFSVSDENINEANERNNGESSLSDCSIIKSETGISGKTPGKVFDNIQCLDNQTCPSEQMVNTTGKNTEKGIVPDASIEDSIGKAINQNEEKCNSATGYDIIQERENINGESSASDYRTNKAETDVAGKEKTLIKVDNNQQGMDGQNCPSNTIANMTGEDSEKDKEPGALNQDHTGKEMEETDAQRISVPNDNIIEQRENNNGESSSSHLSRHEAQSHIGANEKMSVETDDNLQGKEEEKCSSKTTTNMSGDNYENVIKLEASIQEQSEKRIKQSWEQRNSVQDDNIFKQKESNNNKFSFVHLSINKAETDVAGVREKSREADECLQGVDEQNDRSERTAGKKSEKGINLGATTQNHSEKDVKQNQEQWKADSDNNIIEPGESNNRKSSPSVPSRNEIEADAGRKEETSRKGHSNIQGMNIEECVSEPSVNRKGLDSEKDLDEGASNENRSEKDSKQNEVEETSFPEDNAIEPKDSNNRESSSLDSSTREANTNTEEKTEASEKAVDNFKRVNAMKCPSKPIVNVIEIYCKVIINQGVSHQACHEKHSKENGVLQNPIPDENNPQQKGSNNSESRSSDSTADETEIDVAGKQKALEQRDKNLQDIIKHKCTLEVMANMTDKGSEKDIDQNAFTKGRSDKGYAQNETQPFSISDENINEANERNNGESSLSDCSIIKSETGISGKTLGKKFDNIQWLDNQTCPSEQMANMTGKNTEKGIDPDASIEDRTGKAVKQNEEKCNSATGYDIIQERENINVESSASDYCANKAVTDVAGKEETLIKVDNNQQGMGRQNCPSNLIANMTGEDSEDKEPGALHQVHTGKEMEETEAQRISVPNDNIIEQRENNNGESSSSHLSRHEAESHIGGNEKMSVETDDNLQGKDEEKCSSKATTNMSGDNSENDIKFRAPIQEQSEKRIKQSWEQRNSVQDDNIFKQKESNNKDSRFVHLSMNEVETDVAGITEKSRKADECLQRVDEQNDRSERTAGKKSEKSINLGAATQNHSEKDLKENHEQWDSDCGNNIIEHRERNNRESSPSASSTNETDGDAGRKEETSRKGHDNIQGMNIKECISEPMVHRTCLGSENDFDEGASAESRSEKNSKHNEVQENSFPEDNAIEPKDSNEMESSSSDSSIREANRNIGEKNDASEKAVNNLQGVNVTKCPSKPIVNAIETYSEEVIDQGVSHQGCHEKRSKQNGIQQNSIPDENNAQRKGSNNSESRSSDSTTDEAEIDVAGKQKALEQRDTNVQGILKNKCTLEAMANMTNKGSEKDIDQNAFTKGRSDKGYAQNETQPFSISDENINEANERNNGESSLSDWSIIKSETGISGKTSGKVFDSIPLLDNQICPSEEMVDTTGRNAENGIDPDASIEDRTEKAIKQNEEKFNSATGYDIIQQRENINGESSDSDFSANKAEADVAGKEKTLIKVDNNKKGMDGQTCPSNSIANMTGEDSEKDEEPGAFNEDHTGKEMEETDAQRISVPNDNIIEKTESNSGESSSSYFSRHEAESHIGANEKMSVETDDNLQEKGEEKYSSKTTTNMSGYNSGNDINLGALIQEQSEKTLKQNWEQRNSVQDDNIFKQKESSNKESSPSRPSTNEAETDVSCVGETSRKSDHNLQGKVEESERTERIGNISGKKSDKGINLGALNQDDSQKDIIKNQEQWNSDSDNNIIERRENNNRESNPSVSSTEEAEGDAGLKQETSRKRHNSIQDMNIQECILEPMVNRIGLDSGKDFDEGASNESRSEKDSKQNVAQQNSFPEDNAIEQKDSNNMESSSTNSRNLNTSGKEVFKEAEVKSAFSGQTKWQASFENMPYLRTPDDATTVEHKINKVETHSLSNSVFCKAEECISGLCVLDVKGNKGDTQSLCIEETSKVNMVEDTKSVFSGEVTEKKQLLVSEKNIEITKSKEVSNEDGTQKYFVAETLEEGMTYNIISSHLLQCRNTMEEGSESKVNRAECTNETKSSSLEERSSSIKEDLKRINGSDTTENKRYESDAECFPETSIKSEDANRNKSNPSNMSAINIKEINEQTHSLALLDDIKKEVAVKLISVEESSSEANKSEFNSNPSNQNMKCTDTEGEVSSSALMERISGKNIGTIRAERRRKKKETSEEVSFSNYAVSNIDKCLKAKESIDTECGASKKSMDQFIGEVKKKYETNEMTADGELEHNDATKKKKKNSTSSKRDNTVRKHKEKEYQHSLTSEVCHHHHERTVSLSSCCDSVTGNRFRIGKGKSLLTERNIRRYEANSSVQGGMTTSESTPIKDDFIKQNSKHHMIRSDCQRRKDGKNCTVVLHNETLHLTFKTSKSFEIRCKFRPTCEKGKSQEIG